MNVVTVPPGRNHRLKRMLLTAPRAIWLASRLDADLYQIHDPELLPWSYLLIATGRPVVYDIHEDLLLSLMDKSYLNEWLRRPLAGIVDCVEAFLAAPLYHVIAERYYKARYPDAVCILNYPALKFDQVGFDANSSALLYSGNQTSDRGAMTLAAIAADNEDLTVTSVGYCPEELAASMLAKAPAGNIKIIGAGRFVPFSEIVAEYRQKWLAALAVFPDRPQYRKKEATKIFEYMAAGLPVIASNFPVWADLVEANGVGICVPPGDAKAAADAARWLKAHPKKAHAMGSRGQALVAAKFNWSTEASRLIAFYKELCAASF